MRLVELNSGSIMTSIMFMLEAMGVLSFNGTLLSHVLRYSEIHFCMQLSTGITMHKHLETS